MEKTILTKHSQGKKGVNIEKEKYEIIKKSILDCLKNNELTHSKLVHYVSKNLDKFDDVEWYVEAVKLDLEAKKLIERITKANQVIYILIEKPAKKR